MSVGSSSELKLYLDEEGVLSAVGGGRIKDLFPDEPAPVGKHCVRLYTPEQVATDKALIGELVDALEGAIRTADYLVAAPEPRPVSADHVRLMVKDGSKISTMPESRAALTRAKEQKK